MLGGNSQITFESSGVGTQSTSPTAIVREKFRFLLKTNKNEVPNDPDYGCDLIHFVHAPMDDSIIEAMSAVIKMEAGKYLPYINVDEVNAEKIGSGTFKVIVDYSLSAGVFDTVEATIGE